MEEPVVSIITPFFNSEAYFRETLDSVLHQSFGDWELICVDDGSTDNSVAILNEYISNDNRIRVIQRNDTIKGPSHCRNLGIKAAKGKYCLFLDSDDLLSPNCLENRVHMIGLSDYKFVVYPMASFTDSVEKHKVFSRLDAKHFDYYFASSEPAWPVTSSLIRRDFINELNGFDESLIRLEDVEFHLRAIIMSGGNFLVVSDEDPDCFYRITGIQQRFILEKFEASQQPLNGFINRVIHYVDNLHDKRLLSKSFLVILLNVLYVHAIIKMKRGRITNIDVNAIEKYLNKWDFAIYRVIGNIHFTKVRLATSAVVRKIIMHSF